jgi:hypothetical protein
VLLLLLCSALVPCSLLADALLPSAVAAAGTGPRTCNGIIWFLSTVRGSTVERLRIGQQSSKAVVVIHARTASAMLLVISVDSIGSSKT